MTATNHRTAAASVRAAGFEPTTVDAAEQCCGCRRATCHAIAGGPFYCPAHVGRAIEVAEFYRNRDAAALAR